MTTEVKNKEYGYGLSIMMKCPNPKCGYKWEYKGKALFYTSCPRCLHRVNLKKNFIM